MHGCVNIFKTLKIDAKAVSKREAARVANDALGRTSGVTTVFVESTHVPSVVGYRIDRHASSDHARDGVITALCENVPDDAVFWWSNGARTQGPTLSLVKPGSYVSVVISTGGRPVQCLHCSSSGVIDVETALPSTPPVSNVQ